MFCDTPACNKRNLNCYSPEKKITFSTEGTRLNILEKKVPQSVEMWRIDLALLLRAEDHNCCVFVCCFSRDTCLMYLFGERGGVDEGVR